MGALGVSGEWHGSRVEDAVDLVALLAELDELNPCAVWAIRLLIARSLEAARARVA